MSKSVGVEGGDCCRSCALASAFTPSEPRADNTTGPLPAWRMNAAGAILAATTNAYERFTMCEFNDTPLFKACVLTANWNACKKKEVG